jgi:hypothetical protein
MEDGARSGTKTRTLLLPVGAFVVVLVYYVGVVGASMYLGLPVWLALVLLLGAPIAFRVLPAVVTAGARRAKQMGRSDRAAG